MSKVYLMTVTGVSGDTLIGPWRRLITTEDPVEFIAAMRVIAFNEIRHSMNSANEPYSDDQQAEILKKLNIRLHDTGLTEYPESPEGQAELYRRFTTEEEILS